MTRAVWPRLLDAALYLALPLLGLFVWGWDWRPIVLLYWLENVTIGVVTAIGLARRSRAGIASGMPWPFFLAHYGIFTFVHGGFVIVGITIIPLVMGVPAPPFNPLLVVGAWALVTVVQIVLAVGREVPQSSGIGRAYARVMVLHVTVLGAVWLIAAFQLPAIVAVFLVVLHALVDVASTLIGSRARSGAPAGGRRWVQTGPGRWQFVRDPHASPEAAPDAAEQA